MRALRLLGLAIFVCGCGGEPAAPAGAQSPLSPSSVALVQPVNFAGEWQITYHVEACIGRYCYITHINRDEQITLRLLQIGDRVTGTAFKNGLAADLRGLVDAEGRLSLSGGAPSNITDVAALELLRFEAALDAAGGMQGMLQYQALIPGDHNGYSSGSTGPIVRAVRAPFAVTSFTGTWRGNYTTTSCHPGISCLLDRNGDIDLALDERNGAITGRLQTYPAQRIELAGTVSGDSAVLSGTSGFVTVMALRIRRTPTGRLEGTVSLTAANWTSELELLSVTSRATP